MKKELHGHTSQAPQNVNGEFEALFEAMFPHTDDLLECLLHRIHSGVWHTEISCHISEERGPFVPLRFPPGMD
jgi:hypothetical protein